MAAFDPNTVFEFFNAYALDIVQWDGDSDPAYDWEPCFLCGRPVRTDRPHYRVAAFMGDLVKTTTASDADLLRLDQAPGYDGTYAIGSGCQKKLPKGFASK